MSLTRKVVIRFLILSLVFIAPYMVNAIYVPSARDTSMDPDSLVPTEVNLTGLTHITTQGDFEYYYNNKTTVFTIIDTRNNYAWKTGVDKLPSSEIADMCTEIEGQYEDQFDDILITSFGTWQVDEGETRAAFDLDSQEGVFKVRLNGLEDTHTQGEANVTYSGLNFENGTTYQFSFDARSRNPKTVNVLFGEMVGTTFTLFDTVTDVILDTDDLSAYSFDFTMANASTNNGMIIIEMGYIDPLEELSTTLTFDNFSLHEFGGAFGDATEQISQGDFTILDENLTIKEEDVMNVCVPKEVGLIEQGSLPWANSLISIEYFNEIVEGGRNLALSRISATSTYLIETEHRLLDGDTENHKIFESFYELRNDTIPPASVPLGFFLYNNEVVAQDLQFEGTCEEGELPFEGECVPVDPVCEENLLPQEGECVEPEEDMIQTITIYVHVYLEDDGIRFEIKNEEMEGNAIYALASIQIAPFFGAVGGKEQVYDFDEGKYGPKVDKELTPGYSFVPDGSGALIRFKNQTVELDSYIGEVYGTNYTQLENYETYMKPFVPLKNASIPVFGMVHGNNQNAYLGVASSGDEYMRIYSTPDEGIDNLFYNFTYAKFEYNRRYEVVYSQSCPTCGYLDIYEEPNDFDIDLKYYLLAGDGTEGFEASYVGMAQLYRQLLIEDNQLTPLTPDYTDIPIRLDMFMADSENAVFGYSNAVTTKAEDVDFILDKVLDLGITNINTGLLGWSDGGLTLGDPSDTDFTRQIGSKRQFESLIKDFKNEGIDISFSQDYFMINEEQINLRGNAAKHTNNWYSIHYVYNWPIEEFNFARPVKSIEWMLDQTDEFNDLGVTSYTIDGITDNLISDYYGSGNRIESLDYILNGFDKLDDDKMINANQPNSYLWSYVDRYLDSPVYSSQYLIGTDTVPFLQLVLQGTMELYAPYSNFSFYTDSDVLRMIDYNVYPSFILTREPSYVLADSNSKNLYSTEYNLYLELIDSIYHTVNDALRPTLGETWIDREVVENGVIVNTYTGGIQIVINYTEDIKIYDGAVVAPISYKVIGG